MQPQQQAMFRQAPPPAVVALQSSITQLFGSDVLPRLVRPSEADHAARIDSLAQMAAAGEEVALRRFVDRMLRQGETPHQVCQLYLTDIARRLGDFWLEDRCTFVDVTLGVILLQGELRRLAPRLPAALDGEAGHAALMLTAPGENHGFGLAMLAEFFRAGRWAVEEVDAAEATARLAEVPFGLVAISVAHADRALELPPFIAALRRASCQPRLVVMVGGAALNAHPSLLPLLGADATAPDAASALARADALVTLMAEAA